MKIKDFLREDQKELVRDAIVQAEAGTSGEIRVHMDEKCEGDVLEKAAAVFHFLKMDATALQNGILIYLAVKDQKFAIIGDKGINEKVPADFWDQIKEMMIDHFKRHEFAEGLQKGILMAGEKLKSHFPIEENDTDELDNNISFGE